MVTVGLLQNRIAGQSCLIFSNLTSLCYLFTVHCNSFILFSNWTILKLCHFDRQNLKGSNQTPAILLSFLANTATFKSSLSDSLHNRHKPTWSRNDPNKECFQFITWTLYTSIFNILRYVNLSVKQAVIYQFAFI